MPTTAVNASKASKSAGVAALKNTAAAIISCIVLLAVLAIPVHAGVLSPEKILPAVLLITGVSSLVSASRTAAAASSKKMAFALLGGGIFVIVLIVAGAVFSTFSFSSDFPVICGVIMAGSLLGGLIAARRREEDGDIRVTCAAALFNIR